LAPLRGGMVKPLRVLICGIPNVGKSTLINTLSGRKATKTGDEPGITKVEQKIVLASDVYLFDTPGMMWPKILVERSGYHLAASGAIGRNAYDEEEVALELLDTLKGPYGDRLQARYGLVDVAGQTSDALLEAIGKKRGAVQSGGRINLQKAAEVLLNDFRSTALGRISLETPAEYGQWLAEAEAAEAEKQARKLAKPVRRGSRDAPADPAADSATGDAD
jgi:ribosome biogenesis GTPase A